MAQLGSKSNPWIKDPNDIENFSVTYATWVGAESLTGSVWSVVSGTAAIVSDVFSATIATFKVSGGTVGERAAFLNRVTTPTRTKDRTVYIRIKAQ